MLKKVLAGSLAFALVASFGLAPDALAKKSDAQKLKEWQDKMVEKYIKKKKGAISLDWSYWVDMASLEDSRWTIPRKPPFKTSAKQGVQIYATWKKSASATGPSIKILLIKMPHKSEPKGGRQSVFSHTFKYIGESHEVGNVKKLHDGYYRDWVKGATDVLKKKCKKAKKAKNGPAKFYAAAEGTDPESKERERREWFMWTDGQGQGHTWMLRVTYMKDVLKNEGVVKRGVAFAKVIKELKDKRP